jgi:hypothetical protein
MTLANETKTAKERPARSELRCICRECECTSITKRPNDVCGFCRRALHYEPEDEAEE